MRYGQPDHFAAGQPLGNTNSYNGVPAPYVRCAVDPCSPGGFVCWRNPAAQRSRRPRDGAVYDYLRRKGCSVDGGGQITCPAQQPLTGSAKNSPCHVTPTGGTACDTGSGGGHAHNNGGVAQTGTTTGGKGITVTPHQSEPKNGEPSDAKLIDAINHCFSDNPPFGDP